jgi:SAM-dependent methyltransferase
MLPVDAAAWNARYAGADLVWSAGPNALVEQLTGGLPPGRAIDLAAGEGRNAIWLAEHGWRVTAADFSDVALARADRIARERLGADADRLTTVVADLTRWEPAEAAYDLVLLVFLQLGGEAMRPVHRAAAASVAPGGTLLVLAHDRSNVEHGHGGPQDPSVLPTPEQVAHDLTGTGLVLDRAEVVERQVEGAPRPARDCLVLAHRPG